MTPGEVPQITDYVVRIEALLLSQYARSVRDWATAYAAGRSL